jgi:hypothetical protein
MVGFLWGWRGNRPRGHLHPAPPDDLVTVYGNEFVQHDAYPDGFHPFAEGNVFR